MRYLLVWVVVCGLCRPGYAAATNGWPAGPERWANGLRLLCHPTTSSQVVSIDVLVNFSALDEGATPGVRQVLVTSMLQGSQAAGGTTIRQTLTGVGGVLEGRVHPDVLEFTATVPAENLPLGVAALAEIILRPQLTESGIEWAITQTQQRRESVPIGALDTATRLAHDAIYARHPYQTRSLGTPAALGALTPAQVRTAYARYVTPRATVIAVVGRCTPAAVRQAIDGAFGSWSDRSQPPRPALASPSLSASRLVLREMPVRSTCVLLSFPVCGASHGDYLTLRLVETLLGGGTGARLFRTIREERHLAYDVATLLPTQLAASHFTLYALTHSLYLEDTKRALVDELARLQVDLVSAGDLQRAKAYLLGRYQLSHQYSAQHAFDLAWGELIGGRYSDAELAAAVDAITPAQVREVARTYFTHYLLVVIMPPALTAEN
jgi:zinc protease